MPELITTIGSSSANSYISTAEADNYLSNSSYGGTYGEIPSEWSTMSSSEKENLLILSGLLMNSFQWIGWPVYEDQSMSWPRWLKENDYTAETAKLPDAIKKAQAYIAYDVVWRGLQNRTNPAAGPAADAVRSISLFGDINLSFSGEEVMMRDICNLSGLLRLQAYEIYLMLSPYISEVSFIGEWSAPEKLPAVSP